MLFALTAFFPLLYVGYKIFLPGYTVLFEGFLICADVQNVIMLGICIAMLIFRNKSAGRVAKILLGSSVVILPVSRSIMTAVMHYTYTVTDNLATILYLASIVLMMITVFFYIKSVFIRVCVCILFALIMSCASFFNIVSLVFSSEKNRDIGEIPSPDGVYCARVIEYSDDDNRSWLSLAVFVYNRAQSFSIGPVEFMKEWEFINDYPENNNPHLREGEQPLDFITQIEWTDNGEIRIQNKTYSYDGEQVTEPPEPPL